MILLFPATILFIIGYLIKEKKMTSLISGYNTSSSKTKEKYDIDGLTKLMGYFIYGLSALMFIFSLALMVFPTYETLLIYSGFTIVGIYVVIGIILLNLNPSIYKKK